MAVEAATALAVGIGCTTARVRRSTMQAPGPFFSNTAARYGSLRINHHAMGEKRTGRSAAASGTGGVEINQRQDIAGRAVYHEAAAAEDMAFGAHTGKP